MKVGVVWLGDDESATDRAVGYLRRTGASGSGIVLHAHAARLGNLGEAADPRGPYPFAMVNRFVKLFREAKNRDYDFLVVNFGNAFVLSARGLAELLAKPGMQTAVMGARVGKVAGRGLKSSAKTPFVDDNFLILNVRAAAAKKWDARKLFNASHFAFAGGRHAVLAAFLQQSLDDDEFFNFHAPAAFRDRYGDTGGLKPFPFSLCVETGFATCWPDEDGRLSALLDANAAMFLGTSPPGTRNLVEKDGCHFLRRSLPERVFRPFARVAG